MRHKCNSTNRLVFDHAKGGDVGKTLIGQLVREQRTATGSTANERDVSARPMVSKTAVAIMAVVLPLFLTVTQGVRPDAGIRQATR